MPSFRHPLYEKLSQYKFILGSTSPRRLDILHNNLNIKDVTIIGSSFEENLTKEGISNEEYVRQTSRGKAESILTDFRDTSEATLILTSDTVISCNGEIFEKPGTKENQRHMFEKYHLYPDIKVITAVTIVIPDSTDPLIMQDTAITRLVFDTDCSSELVDAYINSEEGLQVAGGFKFQELGSLFFKGIEGDYFNVVGLPVATTFHLLEQAVSK
ncbi:hypothetical protein PICST_57283 [Scheffersomyces stipitis CBS 6054]|uniref:Maf-like protein n=1 Tax=Scheffersomyces stipitis (strain ATCC 58785 / CBS 6054 / NBRC 10063 / NRRL Y-11545) TaxID=322104 RepID=A3LSC0_PICST|nr:hypothetical protein PICST_57283 [Scheffersomyces stipitis CBS 6054]ABN65542.2 hypothetical protein PICST_57283 [Scheffersomyces stipitis CBS 6054]KAG2733704.1 hypothetical protein G9P44_003229 [Scheffersomyces stipitis]